MRRALTLLILASSLCAQGSDPVAWAMESLLDYRNVEEARRVLQGHPISDEVVEAAKAALERDTPSVRGKQAILKLLMRMKRQDPVEAAIKSPVASTRRAAAYTLHSAAEFAEPARKIVLGWLKDRSAYDQDWAVILSWKMKIEGALPVLQAMMEDPTTSPRLLTHVLTALAAKPTPEFKRVLLERLRNPELDTAKVAAFLRAAKRVPDIDAGEVGAAWLKRPEAGGVVRNLAALLVTDPSVLRGVLLDAGEEDWIVQRSCLRRLLGILDTESLHRLAREARVARHPYFGIRVDVAVLLACVPTTEEADLAILRDYLVDEDPKDTQLLVRQEGWLSLWTVTGAMHGVNEATLFAKPPPRGDLQRGLMPSFLRSGVSNAMVEALKPLSADLAHMRKVRADYSR
ncbi:MAG: hypothetical protein ACYSUN_10160 [Planctomycetota bacterium]|jgi:hypothetical protein